MNELVSTQGTELQGLDRRLGRDRGHSTEAARRELREQRREIAGLALESNPKPLRDERGLEGGQAREGNVGVVQEGHGIRGVRAGDVDEVHEPLEAE